MSRSPSNSKSNSTTSTCQRRSHPSRRKDPLHRLRDDEVDGHVRGPPPALADRVQQVHHAQEPLPRQDALRRAGRKGAPAHRVAARGDCCAAECFWGTNKLLQIQLLQIVQTDAVSALSVLVKQWQKVWQFSRCCTELFVRSVARFERC